MWEKYQKDLKEKNSKWILSYLFSQIKYSIGGGCLMFGGFGASKLNAQFGLGKIPWLLPLPCLELKKKMLVNTTTVTFINLKFEIMIGKLKRKEEKISVKSDWFTSQAWNSKCVSNFYYKNIKTYFFGAPLIHGSSAPLTISGPGLQILASV